jgi:hypothetical protein
MKTSVKWASGIVLLMMGSVTWAAPPGVGYHPKVSVTAETRLDWTFALTNQSLTRLPANWLKDYDSTKQTYELYVPPRKSAKALYPVLLYVSPGDGSGALKTFEKVVKARGMIFASPHHVGNSVPSPQRVRIILDVLDDLRRNYPIDVDRTYITGVSGGARVACAIAYALPELFGGVMPIVAGGDLREESWLRQRVADRLRVAHLTGEKDFNRGEVEKIRGPFLKAVGVQGRVWTQKGLGHATPGPTIQSEGIAFLEAGLKERQALAKKYPAARIDAKADTSRSALAKALLAEGKERLKDKKTLYSGLMQLKGVRARWPDLEAAKDAKKVLEEYDNKTEKPWEEEDIAEQRKFLLARARTLTDYGTGALSSQYEKMRPNILKAAKRYWEKIIQGSPDSAAGKEGKKKLAEIEKRLGKEE